MELRHQLTPHLTKLRLSGILQTLEARNRQAVESQWSYIEFLARLLEDEVERRAQKQLVLRLRRAAVNSTKTLESFDFSFNPGINRQQVLQLGSCDFIRQQRNVLICGPTGTGKTHLAQALIHEAARQGFDAVFTTTHKMLQHIHGGRADGTWDRRLQTYLRPALLVLDDFGLKPLQSPAPSDLYDVIDGRYEKSSIVLTSNRAPSEWPEIFLDPSSQAPGWTVSATRPRSWSSPVPVTEPGCRQGDRPMSKLPSADAKPAVTCAQVYRFLDSVACSQDANWAERANTVRHTLPSYAVTSWCSGRSSPEPYPPASWRQCSAGRPAGQHRSRTEVIASYHTQD